MGKLQYHDVCKKQKLVDALRDKMQNTPNDDSKTSSTINNDGIEGAI